LAVNQDRITAPSAAFLIEFGNEQEHRKLSPGDPHLFVDNLCMDFDVGAPQRREIEQWRGFQRSAFGYNESPTSSCHTFCWKARQYFDVPFFCASTRREKRREHR
jgi:hypothetical protein